MDSTAPPEVTSMASNTITVNGLEVKCDISKPSVINIHFSQPAAPSCFQDFCTAVGNALKPVGDSVRSHVGSPPMPPVNLMTEVKIGLQVSRILLGCASISLGAILYGVNRSRTFQTGVAFWTGIPFILSGILSLGKEKTTSSFWNGAASLANLTSLVVSIAGIIVIADDLKWWYDYDSYYNQSLLHGVRVLMLVVTIFAMIINVCCGLSDLMVWCCTPRPRQGEAGSMINSSFQPLDPSVLPPAYEEKKKDFRTV